jgi:hypothetical protein
MRGASPSFGVRRILPLDTSLDPMAIAPNDAAREDAFVGEGGSAVHDIGGHADNAAALENTFFDRQMDAAPEEGGRGDGNGGSDAEENASSDTGAAPEEGGRGDGNGDSDTGSRLPPLPAHLANLPPEQRVALEQRMQRELAIDEARNRQPRRRIDRNAKQLYCAAMGTSSFLLLLLFKVDYCAKYPWILVFAPLCVQYFTLFVLTMLEVRDTVDIWQLNRNSPIEGQAFATAKMVVSKVHESLWHLVCLLTAPLLAVCLAKRDEEEEGWRGELAMACTPVWVYGGVSGFVGFAYFVFTAATKCRYEQPGQTLRLY